MLFIGRLDGRRLLGFFFLSVLFLFLCHFCLLLAGDFVQLFQVGIHLLLCPHLGRTGFGDLVGIFLASLRCFSLESLQRRRLVPVSLHFRLTARVDGGHAAGKIFIVGERATLAARFIEFGQPVILVILQAQLALNSLHLPCQLCFARIGAGRRRRRNFLRTGKRGLNVLAQLLLGLGTDRSAACTGICHRLVKLLDCCNLAVRPGGVSFLHLFDILQPLPGLGIALAFVTLCSGFPIGVRLPA